MSKTVNKKARTASIEQKRVVVLIQTLVQSMTLEEIAPKIDVSFATVSRWSRGVTTPYRSAARRVLPLLERMALRASKAAK